MRPIIYETIIKPGKPFERQLKSFGKEAGPHLSGLYASRSRRHITSRRKRIFLPSFRFDPVAEQMLRELDAIHEQNIAYQPVRSKDDEITGVIAIGRVLETSDYLLQRDILKQRGMTRWNFTSGGRESKSNETPMMALNREYREETNINIIQNAIEEISNIRLRQRTPEEPKAYSKVFFVVLREEQLLEMKPGEEQEELGLFTEEEIEQFIREDVMPVNHINAWRAYQWWRNNLPKLKSST